MVFLVIGFFFERYCFVLMVYKSKNYGLVLIMIIIAMNAIFLRIIMRLRQHKIKKRLHEIYNIHTAPRIGYCEICFVAFLDLMKAFFLFWPANVVPIWLLLTMLQYKIPFITLLRSCCIEEVSHYLIHWFSALLIFVGCIVNIFTLKYYPDEDNGTNYKFMTFYLLLSCGLDVISHTIKEALVRAQPINQEKFNF